MLVKVINKLLKVNPTDAISIVSDKPTVQVPTATVHEVLPAKLMPLGKVIRSYVLVISEPEFRWIGLVVVSLIVE